MSEFMNREMTPIQVRLLHDLMQSKREHGHRRDADYNCSGVVKAVYWGRAYIVHKWIEMENLDVVFA